MDSIKVNGGSFKLTAVLSYSSEDAFVEYYNRVLSTWLKPEKRIATLREVYKIAHDIKSKQDDNAERNARKTARSGRGAGSENDNRANKTTDNRQESRPANAGDSL